MFKDPPVQTPGGSNIFVAEETPDFHSVTVNIKAVEAVLQRVLQHHKEGGETGTRCSVNISVKSNKRDPG